MSDTVIQVCLVVLAVAFALRAIVDLLQFTDVRYRAKLAAGLQWASAAVLEIWDELDDGTKDSIKSGVSKAVAERYPDIKASDVEKIADTVVNQAAALRAHAESLGGVSDGFSPRMLE